MDVKKKIKKLYSTNDFGNLGAGGKKKWFKKFAVVWG